MWGRVPEGGERRRGGGGVLEMSLLMCRGKSFVGGSKNWIDSAKSELGTLIPRRPFPANAFSDKLQPARFHKTLPPPSIRKIPPRLPPPAVRRPRIRKDRFRRSPSPGGLPRKELGNVRARPRD